MQENGLKDLRPIIEYGLNSPQRQISSHNVYFIEELSGTVSYHHLTDQLSVGHSVSSFFFN